MAIGYILTTGKQGVIDSSTSIDPGVVQAADIDDAALGNGLQGGYKSEDQTSAAISVKPANGGPITVTTDGVSVQAATASIRGTMSSDDFVKLGYVCDDAFRFGGTSISGADTIYPVGVMANNTVAMIEARLVASNLTHSGKYLVLAVMMGIYRNGSGPVTNIGTGIDVVTKIHTAGTGNLNGVTVTLEAGSANGDWSVRVLGNPGDDVYHTLTLLVNYIPSQT